MFERRLARLLALAVLLGTLGIAGPAYPAPGPTITVGFGGTANCSTVNVIAEWTAVNGQAHMDFTVRQGGASDTDGVPIDPGQTTKTDSDFPSLISSTRMHHFSLTAQLTDASNNVLLSGRVGVKLPCTFP